MRRRLPTVNTHVDFVKICQTTEYNLCSESAVACTAVRYYKPITTCFFFMNIVLIIVIFLECRLHSSLHFPEVFSLLHYSMLERNILQ